MSTYESCPQQNLYFRCQTRNRLYCSLFRRHENLTSDKQLRFWTGIDKHSVYTYIRCTRISLECQSSTELGTIVLINGAVSRHLFATIAYPTKLNYNAYANYTRGFVSHLYILRRVYYVRTIYCCFFFMRFSVYITLKPSVAEL